MEDRLVPATFFVTNTFDSGGNSLRAAIANAKSNPGPDTIQFLSVTGTITLTTGELAITDTANLDIVGPGAGSLTIKSNGSGRVFSTTGASAGTVINISGVTIANGNAAGGGGLLIGDESVNLTNCVVSGNTSTLDGGGIYVTSAAGSLNLQGCSINNNLTTGSGVDGGGVALQLASTMTMNNTTVSGNTSADCGGGVYFRNGGQFTITNSTVSGNVGGSALTSIGGGLYFFGIANGPLVIQNSTISTNSIGGAGGGIVLASFTGSLAVQNSTVAFNASTAVGSVGGGIARTGGSGSLSLDSAIVAKNTSQSGNGPDLSFTSLTLITGSGNLVGVTGNGAAGGNGVLSVTGNQFGTPGNAIDPLLGPLQLNNGETKTHRPLFNSPAIDKGSNPASLGWDQRGVTRVLGAAADVGAVETGSSIVVTNTNDSGPGSLRQAVQDANLDVGYFNVVTFDSSYFNVPRTITLTSGEIALTEGGGITGPGNLTIDANGLSRHFNIDGSGGQNFYLTDMKLINGKADDANGGSIHLMDEILTLSKVTLSNNVSLSGNGGNGGHGGAIALDAANGKLIINDCVLINNTAVGAVARGGAIGMEHYGTLTMQRTLIANNISGGDGGGIAMKNGGSVSLTDCTLNGNQANFGFGNSQNGGGAIYFYGQANSGFTMLNTTFSGNQATVANGGAVFLGDLAGSALFQNCTLTGNSAGNKGGAISSMSGSSIDTITLESSIVAGNTGASGPDVYSGWTVKATASALGSKSGIFTANLDGTTQSLLGLDLKLGPLANNGGSTPTHLPAADSPVVNKGTNSAGLTNDQRGNGYGRIRSGGVDIGAVEAPTNFVVTNANNSGAGSFLQAVYDANSFTGLDTVTFDSSYFSVPRTITPTGEVDISEAVTIVGPGAAMATVSGNNTNRILNTLPASGVISISGLTFTGGKATDDGGAIFYGNSGGAIMTGNETLNLVGCVFTGNSAPGGSGGAVCSTYDGILNATDCTFSSNSALWSGGALSGPNTAGTMSLLRCSITGNVTNGNGGGVQVYRNLIVDHCTISGNWANGMAANDGMGGGITVNANVVGAVSISNSTISGNRAEHDGGGLRVGGGFTLFINNCTITNNTATTGKGGGLFRSSGYTVNVDGSVISGNASSTSPDIANTGTTNVNFSAIGKAAGFTLTGGNNLAFDTDLKLGPLANNGGPTQTHKPAANSPLINAGPLVASLGTDQRGVSRTLGGRTDIGSVEYVPTLIVTNTSDSGTGSLRQCISDANINPGYDTITFDPAVFAFGQTIRVNTGELLVTDEVSIVGPGSGLTTVDAQGNSRVFNVYVSGVGKSVSISGLTITGGHTNEYGGGLADNVETLTLNDVSIVGNNSDKAGGGIITSGNVLALNIYNSTVSNNNTASHGGGISFESGTQLTVLDSTIAGNYAFYSGGGLNMYFGGSLTLDNSTISGNSAGNYGGGMYFFGTVGAGGFKIRNSTLSGNSASNDGGGIALQSLNGTLLVRNSTITANTTGNKGGGIGNTGPSGVIQLDSTIISGNSTNVAGPDISAPGTVNAGSVLLGSLAGIGTFNPDAVTTSLIGKAPLLGPLANNGGKTRTHALLPGSPAINNGSNLSGLTTDQRDGGFVRVFGGAPDIGAFEVQTSAKVTSVVVNNGAAQRSRVTTIDVTFDMPVSIAFNAFQITRQSDGAPVAWNAALNGNTVTITFTGGAVNGNSLADGRYTLVVAAQGVNFGNFDGNGDGTAGDDYTIVGSPSESHHLFRLFGDADGNGLVDGVDFGAFRTAFNTNSNVFDFDGSGIVDGLDFGQFRSRFGVAI